MACTFCATGTMKLRRNLLADEIVDQYRFWRAYLKEKNIAAAQRVVRVLFICMGSNWFSLIRQ